MSNEEGGSHEDVHAADEESSTRAPARSTRRRFMTRPGAPRLRAVATEANPLAGLDDALLQAGRGDRDAFAEVYDLLADVAYGLARSVVRDPHLAEDIVQEAFVDIWRNAPRFERERGSSRSWCLSIVHRRAVDRVRREQSDRARVERDAITAPPERDSEDTADAALARLDRLAAGPAVAEALTILTPPQREAIELAYFHGRTHREIAEMLETPLGTIKTRLRDALIKLRDATDSSFPVRPPLNQPPRGLS
jgi:RNA polymerase sigma-70 factor (ECF subfamily)